MVPDRAARASSKPYDRSRSTASASTSVPHHDTAIDVNAKPPVERKPILAHLNDSSAARSRALTSKKALQLESNPITNSTACSRAFQVSSASSGHQQDCGQKSRETKNAFASSRNSKLRNQAAAKKTSILTGVSIWINGLAGCGLSNLQLIELVQSNGGEWRPNFSGRGTTHMISVKELSGSKTQKQLSQINSPTKIIHTQWLIDSVAAGRRLPETKYLVLSCDSQPAIGRILSSAASSSKPMPTRNNSGSATSASSLELPATPMPIELDDELAWLANKRGNVKYDPTAMPGSAQPH